MRDDISNKPPSTNPNHELTPAELAAWLVILERMTMSIASTVETVAAQNMGMTLAGIRSHLAELHKLMLDSLLNTNAEIFEAGMPYAERAIHAMYANVERAMSACGATENTLSDPGNPGPSPGEAVN